MMNVTFPPTNVFKEICKVIIIECHTILIKCTHLWF